MYTVSQYNAPDCQFEGGLWQARPGAAAPGCRRRHAGAGVLSVNGQAFPIPTVTLGDCATSRVTCYRTVFMGRLLSPA